MRSDNTHGTGCAFSTAIACHLARGEILSSAVLAAKSYVAAAIANAYPVGKGIGPVNHMYRNERPSAGEERQQEAGVGDRTLVLWLPALQQNSRQEGRAGRQQPLNAPELDGFESLSSRARSSEPNRAAR